MTFIPTADMPLMELAEHYIANADRLSETSARLKRVHFRNFNRSLGRDGTLADLTDEALRAHMRNRVNVVSDVTAVMEIKSLLAVWRWAVTEGWTVAPRVKAHRPKPRTPEAWTRRELKALFRAAAQYEISGPGGAKRPASVFFVTLLKVLLDTGERLNAVRLLRWSEVDLDNRFVKFKAANRKNAIKASDNLQRFSRQTRGLLKALKAEQSNVTPDSRVFGSQHHSTLYYHLERILKSAGLPADHRSKFHRMRRTHATWLFVLGGDATFSLGHSSDDVTRTYYLDPRYCRRGYAADLLSGGLLRPLRELWRTVKLAFGYW